MRSVASRGKPQLGRSSVAAAPELEEGIDTTHSFAGIYQSCRIHKLTAAVTRHESDASASRLDWLMRCGSMRLVLAGPGNHRRQSFGHMI